MLDTARSVNRASAPFRLFLASLSLLCASCASNSPSHLPNPLELPGAIVGTAVENATYGGRRNRVKTHISENYETLLKEISVNGGPALIKSYDLARVPAAERAHVTQMLRTDARLRADIEALTVTLMVHGP